MSNFLKIIGLIGIILFGCLFAITYTSSDALENSAKSFVSHQIEKEIRNTNTLIKNSNTGKNAAAIAEQLGIETKNIEYKLDSDLPQKIANIIASMCGYDCERSKAIAKEISGSYLERLKSITVAQDTLGNIVKGKYIKIIENLKFDLRIFLGSNFSMFLILLIISFLKPKAIQHLFLPGILLLVSTLISSCIYIFGQDWFYTILYNDYMGFAYLAYIVVIFGLLIDISLNHGRITTEILNGILDAVGSALSVVTC